MGPKCLSRSFFFSSAPTPTGTHFWLSDNGDNYEMWYVGWPWTPWQTFPNAYVKALKFINGGWKLLYLAEGSRWIKEYEYSSLIELAKTGIITQTGYYNILAEYTSLNPPQQVTLNV